MPIGWPTSRPVPSVGGVHLVELSAEQTHPLRRSVLRDGTTTDDVDFEGDDLASTFHLGIDTGDRVIAVSSWMERRYPDRPGDAGYQLRGMATATEHRGKGLGMVLLDAGIEICRARGATVLWARARDGALGFYERHGFATVGAGYVDLSTGLPHHDVIREIG